MHLAEVRRRLYSSVKKAREALQACRTRSSRPHHVATHGEKHSAQTLASLHSLQRRRKSAVPRTPGSRLLFPASLL